MKLIPFPQNPGSSNLAKPNALNLLDAAIVLLESVTPNSGPLEAALDLLKSERVRRGEGK